MNELMSNLQEALQASGVEQEAQVADTASTQENSFIDEIVPLNTASKETQFSGK